MILKYYLIKKIYFIINSSYTDLDILSINRLGFLDEINSNYRFSIISELVSSKSEIIFNEIYKNKRTCCCLL